MDKESLTKEKQALSNAHGRSIEDIVSVLDTDLNNGLSDDEVKQRLETFGPNELEEREQASLWKILFDQINNPVVYLLSAAALVAFIFGDVPEAIAILVVIVLNTAIGFWMEYQALRSMEALKQMDRMMAKVKRDGQEAEVDATDLVPGDIILMSAGTLVPADARVVEESELSVDESSLTGESVPVPKQPEAIDENALVADRTNMIFKGTSVTNGSGAAIVTATGMSTQLGDISALVQREEEDKIPLNKKLEGLTKRLIWLTLGLAALFFLFGWMTGQDLYRLVQTAIAWAIAAIPEGLPIVASIALARGMLRLADHNVIVKRLAAVETLGETNVIFTDKTGTLTENVLTLSTLVAHDRRWQIEFQTEGEGVEVQHSEDRKPEEDERLGKFFQVSVLCNDASLESPQGNSAAENGTRNEVNGQGDPLDQALLRFARAFDDDEYNHLLNQERKAEEPFDSDDMVMGTVYEMENTALLYSKGAPEAILERCSKVHSADRVMDMSQEMREKWLHKNEELTGEGLRVIAFAWKELKQLPAGDGDVEEQLMQNMVFLGLAGFIDPPAKQVRESVETCHEAGIRVTMVTGDHPGTARNIGRQVGIITGEDDRVMDGAELKDMSEDDRSQITDIRIFARVDPRQKLDIIRYYRENGAIVGMTGDGVNDTPALKKADIGIAMGKRGTQAAKETTDMVLKDDAFPSIVEAIREGRIIFGNIRKFIIYQLSYHLAEILLIGLISFALFLLPLMPLQLLFLNLLSDVFPALALGIGRGSPGVMQHKPKKHDEPIINRQSWRNIILYGVIIAASVTGAYLWAYRVWELSPELSNNVAFFSLAFAQLLHVFNMRDNDEPLFNNQVTRNKYVWLAVGFCTVVLLAAYYTPVLKEVLSFYTLGLREWGLIVISSFVPLLVIQTYKQIRNYD